MRLILSLLVLTFTFGFFGSNSVLEAHPWGGLVIDSDGNVYFTFTCPIVDDHHYACVWMIDQDGNTQQILNSRYSPSDIILSRSPSRYVLAAERSGQSPSYRNMLWEIHSDSISQVNPAKNYSNAFHIQAYAIANDSTLYFARDGQLFSLQKNSTASEIDLGRTINRIDLVSIDGDGTLYLVADNALYKKSETGLKLIANSLKDNDPENIPFRGANILFDMCIDDSGNVYLAYYGNRRVLKVSPSGDVSTLLKSEGPWSPSGVDIYQGELYVLESTIGDGAWWKFWNRDDNELIPRIRKLGKNGTISTIYEYQLED
ncbi:MAG: hypothetical protein JJ895_09820 [Balneolaceae bacterium]|nr:hypothetical protein [Balneolaceae bacterium]